MQTSPLQLNKYYFIRCGVIARDIEHDGSPISLDGVPIQETVSFAVAHGEDDNPKNFAVRLRIEVRNDEETKAPYSIDFEIEGYFTIIDDGIPIATRPSFAVINGCAILYSVIREQVLSITARSLFGEMLLPTVNFLDHKETK